MEEILRDLGTNTAIPFTARVTGLSKLANKPHKPYYNPNYPHSYATH